MKNENENQITERRKNRISVNLGNIMQCLRSGEQLLGEEMVSSSESLATKDYTHSAYSSQAGEAERKPDTGNIEEAESSLRESGSLNYEEARALLGRYEYQKGNLEAALHVFEGIDIAAVTPKMKITLSKRGETQAAQSCTVILDIVESSLPAGLPENFGCDCKLQETINETVELLPGLWKLADFPSEAILSYRRALLHQWNLDAQTTAKIQKEFAIVLLYSGDEANPPSLQSQIDRSFVPRNNTEEAILLLIILLRKFTLKRIEWDPSILDHLSYALSISGGLRALANQVEELLPGIIDRKERYHILALCYHGEGDDLSALNLWQKMLKGHKDPTCVPSLLFASKICGESTKCTEDGIFFAARATESLHVKCHQLVGVANCMLGISLSANSRSCGQDSGRVKRQSEALKSLEIAGTMTRMNDPGIVYHLCLENAEQRKLDMALHYAKCLLKLEGGFNLKGWILLARILSAQKRFLDAETIINAALDQTGKWDQGELLQTKAKLQIAQDLVKEAIETYTQLLAVLQVQRKSFGSGKQKENKNHQKNLEIETWHNLASIYIRLSQWCDVEICLSKSEAISSFSASRWHTTGLLHEAKGHHEEALKAFMRALDVDPMHVPSLVCTAVVLRRIDSQSSAIVRSLLTEAIRLDRMNASAWYNLGLLYKDEGGASALEAAECFEAAALLEESEPVQPFR